MKARTPSAPVRSARAGICAAVLALAVLPFARVPLRAEDIPAIPVVKPKPSSPIHFSSDELEYRESEQVIVATGNVTVRQDSYTFQSDHAHFDIPGKRLDAWGAVRFWDGQRNQIRSRFLDYDAGTGEARLMDAEGTVGPWLFAARRIDRGPDGGFTLRNARLSTCENDLSKYHLYGWRVHVLPGRRLTVWNAFFRIGPVPVFYLPYYYYSLGEKHLAFQFFPGQNESEGPFVRTVWGYPVTDQTYVKVYLDELTRRGLGTGGEFDYYNSGKVKGSLYGYHINDRLLNGQERWNVRFFHWQQVSQNWLIQSNFNQMSDEQFPNDFVHEDYDRVAQALKSSLAFSYQKNNVLFHLSGERSDTFDPVNNRYYPSEILLPRADLTFTQTPLGFWGIDRIIEISAVNRFAGVSPNSFPVHGGNPFVLSVSSPVTLDRTYRGESEQQFTLLRQFVISRTATLVPRVSIKNEWKADPQGVEPTEPFVQRLQAESTLHQSFSRYLDVDLSYLLTQRLQDNLGDDQGREDHLLRFFAWVRPNDRMDLRMDTAHVLPRFKGEPLAFLDRRNYQPLNSQFSYAPRPGSAVLFNASYNFYDPNTGSSHLLNSSSEFVWGHAELGGDYFSVGGGYNSALEHTFELRNRARVSLFRLLSLEGILRSLVQYQNQDFLEAYDIQAFEKDVVLRTSWRCWDFAFSYQDRKGVLEYMVNIELRFDREERQKSASAAREAEWYPWRNVH